MALTIFTTTTNPIARGDNFMDALQCYAELADEFVLVDGSTTNKKDDFVNMQNKNVNYVYNQWPREFNWPFIGEQFQRGYEAATGDWVIHMDLDFIFHEKDFDNIREACEKNSNSVALSFWKYQFIQPDRYNLKSRVVLAVNKRLCGDRIKFNSGGDLCQPSLDGAYILPDTVPEARVAFYNYEKLTKTAEQIMDDCGRMERAYKRHFGVYQMGSDGSDESAFDRYIKLLRGRLNKDHEHIKLSEHPKFVQETILNLRPDQFGFNGFGLLGDNDYMKEIINA